MNKFIISILLIFCFAYANAQLDSTKRYQFSKQEYLAKSKTNKRTGLILLAVGAVMTTSGSIGILNEPDYLEANSSDGPYWLFVTGIMTMGTSVPLFIISANQSNKAATLIAHFSMEKTIAYDNDTGLQRIGLNALGMKPNPHQSYFPALSIKLNMHK